MKNTNLLSLIIIALLLIFNTKVTHATSFISDNFKDIRGGISEEVIHDDQWESFNRAMFGFNNVIYKYILGPIAKGYDFIVPDKVEGSISKFFHNVETPVRFFNNIFQGQWADSGTELSRFAINTTLGIVGFFDPAESKFGIEMQDEDFGQTLAYHGVESGIYIVWPIFGSSTVRDTFGLVMDTGLSPINWLFFLNINPKTAVYVAHEIEEINSLSYETGDNYLKIIDAVNDPYLAIQNAYIQIRERKINE
ncbi:Outer-membrane-phospholipid-binding lipoprotein MlaA [hydrothermal vent metagenome]|uniref:Outer-membrane-phospholipid-binding lipoprotein MlaA n=1 Tax=hydrothermal vent metagenome TaxID=652676 RepID=A0A3B1DHH1_9ZZZZ